MDFKLNSDYIPTGDQPEAIAELSQGVLDGNPRQTLLGVTGSGKTFTMANVIQKVNRPTLILSHNKTLAAQLYSEFRNFFPDNSVQYFVSYYDYYQPEAYIPGSDKYIEKDLMINDRIEKLRLSTAAALMSGRRKKIRHHRDIQERHYHRTGYRLQTAQRPARKAGGQGDGKRPHSGRH